MEYLTVLLIETINNIIQKKVASMSYDKIGFIKDVNKDNTCNVIIEKQEYTVKNGIGIEFSIGNNCLVHFINGNENNKVIIAKL
ncbi:hypothetical protein LJC58_03890 [Lachnospiraceae bacterium OttesenSCG-928-D06]|nr:hypothetical protein [Lachnospiraceae bacterium OttesenSCG-928-D06]